MPPGGGGGAGSYPPPNLHLHDDSSSKSYEPSDVFCALGSLIAEGRLPSSSADFSADIGGGQEQQPLDMTTGTNESSTHSDSEKLKIGINCKKKVVCKTLNSIFT